MRVVLTEAFVAHGRGTGKGYDSAGWRSITQGDGMEGNRVVVRAPDLSAAHAWAAYIARDGRVNVEVDASQILSAFALND